MKGMKGKLLKKLKTIKSIGYLKPERILQVNASDGYLEAHVPPKSAQIQVQTQKNTVFVREKKLQDPEPEIIDVTELMKDLEAEEMEIKNGFNEKENIRPETGDKNRGFSVSVWEKEKGKSEALKLGQRDFEYYEIEYDDESINIPKNQDENRGISVSISNPEKEKLEPLESRIWKNKIDPNKMRPIQELGERDFVDYEIESDDGLNEKENIRPQTGDTNRGFSVSVFVPEKGKQETVESRFGGEKIDPLKELDVSKFRRPDLDSSTLFDPNLLVAFEQAVKEFKAQEAEKRVKIKEKELDLIEDENENENEQPPLKSRKLDEDRDPLLDFEEKCPPGGSNSVIVYTTGLRTIRKTFEDCHGVRFLLESFRVLFFERDISMHSEYREELWRIMGKKLAPPCLFIRGRYIGGAERVLALHEQGKLRPLFEGVPIDRFEGPCDGCGGARFVVCFSCHGSNKATVFYDVLDVCDDMAVDCDDMAEVRRSCPECNENGLIVCPICC